jgi:hypothetical protein
VPRKKRVPEVMVVPVKEEAFAAARKLHVYAVPITRSASDVKHIAFYRGAPISAITHHAKVKGIDKNLKFQEVFPKGSSVLSREDLPLKVYKLEPLVELARRVKKGRNRPISGPRYTELKDLEKARYLDEVWPTEEKDEEPKAQPRGRAKAKGKPKAETRAEAKGEAPPPEPVAEPKKGRRKRGGRKKKEEPADVPAKAEPEKGVDKPARGKRERASRKKRTDVRAEGPKPSVHYIVDGSNVALEARSFKEGGRLKQIELLVDKLSEAKGAAVTVIVDANLRHHIDRRDDLEAMINDRRVLQAPAQTDADEFILLTAEFHRSKGEDVVIVSNDRYKDYIKRFAPRFDWIGKSQQQFMFVFSHDGSEVLEAMVTIT